MEFLRSFQKKFPSFNSQCDILVLTSWRDLLRENFLALPNYSIPVIRLNVTLVLTCWRYDRAVLARTYPDEVQRNDRGRYRPPTYLVLENSGRMQLEYKEILKRINRVTEDDIGRLCILFLRIQVRRRSLQKYFFYLQNIR